MNAWRDAALSYVRVLKVDSIVPHVCNTTATIERIGLALAAIPIESAGVQRRCRHIADDE